MGWFADAYAFLAKGGPVMIPLMACSVISVAVAIERYFTIRRATADSSDLARSVEDWLYNGESELAAAECEKSETPVGTVLAAGIRSRKLGADRAERVMEEQAQRVVSSLQIRLGMLDTIVTIAPLLGLLGTVVGMIRSFHVISSKSGISQPTAITGGVAEALIATATGLAIAIFSVVAYNYLNERIKRSIEIIEIRATHLVNVLSDIEDRRNEIKSLSA
ncbi:MAG TPA: MotA/TolQ/ExbB proton channel family protein [Armatimonadota bacterium]|nr:MotA/TolQ/ExbB proton channel family protein [Armatimonadota bacterium]